MGDRLPTAIKVLQGTIEASRHNWQEPKPPVAAPVSKAVVTTQVGHADYTLLGLVLKSPILFGLHVQNGVPNGSAAGPNFSANLSSLS